jgi:uncharacterized membrane protein
MDNKDVEGVIEWLTTVAGKIGDGILTVLDATPDFITGLVVTAIFLIWVYKKVND